MTHATISDKNLVLTLKGINALLAFKNNVIIPLSSIKKVSSNTLPLMPYSDAAFGLGTIFASKIQAGTFKQNGEKSFWDVRNPKNAIMLTLKNHDYEYVVVEVPNSKKTIAAIKAKI